MATVLIAWELGGGLGHLMQLKGLVRALAGRGHQVYAALRHLARAEAIFGNGVATFLSAPAAVAPPEQHISPPLTFAQLLHNMGWYERGELRGLCAGWRSLCQLIPPDLVG